MGVQGTDEKCVLIIDDDVSILELLRQRLTSCGYRCDVENDGLCAVQKMKNERYDLLVLDINMPYIKGTELLTFAKKNDSETPVIMISGTESIDLVRQTLRQGACDYLVKPLDLDELELSAEHAIELGCMKRQLREYREELERQVDERTKRLADALERIEQTYNATILALGSALETRDIETNVHGLRVAFYSHCIALESSISDREQLTNIERGAYLHDIGKIGVPDAILRKPTDLTDEEWTIMKTHPAIGKNMIEGISFLKGAIPIVYFHHEWYDGNGYPQGISGEAIPFEARIFSVADALDALVSDRAYRSAIPLADARKIIRESAGTQFDPKVIAGLENIDDEALESFEARLSLGEGLLAEAASA